MDKGETTSPSCYKQVNGETRMLLDFYGRYLPQIGPLKRFKNKKEMWYKISEDIPNKTAKQCQERYKTILRRKKSAVENNNTSGSQRQKVDFEEELMLINAIDDSIEPEIQISSQKCVKKEVKEKENPSKRKSSVQDALIEIAKMKEEARERRHKEKMEAIKEMKEYMEKLFQSK
ncbi:uncharacterized protein LOC142225907 [Haematobia irritans]|uniref:uncharacterized protein LOC142225907 n=1 Tax=Haematobia irritans TaxID=7368 RepID=UPI003F50C9F7